MILPPYDILCYWVAARLIARGSSPYLFAEYYAEHQLIASDIIVYPFNYPPPALFWLLPLAWMDLEVASVVWRIILIVSYLFAAKIIFGILRDKFNVGKSTELLVLPTIVAFPFYDWFWGNSNSITFLLFALILRGLYYKSSPFWIGLLFSGLALKPHFFVPLGVCLVIEYIKAKGPKFFLGLIVGAAIQFLPVYLMSPEIFSSFLQGIGKITEASHQFAGISISSAFHHAFGLLNPVNLLLAFLLVPGIILSFSKAPLFERAVLSMPLVIALAPHANMHAILFTAPMYWYFICKHSHKRRLAILLSNSCLVVLMLFAPDAYWSKFLDLPIFTLLLMGVLVVLSILGIRMLQQENIRVPN